MATPHIRRAAGQAHPASHRFVMAGLTGLLLMHGTATPAQGASSPATPPPPPGASAATPRPAAAVVPGQPATTAQEVDALLGAVTRSGCDFQRNGSWHDARAAEAHLRDKYNYLHDKIHRAEDFIELAATRSAVTGTPYAMRCAGLSISTHQWLSDRLVALRSAR